MEAVLPHLSVAGSLGCWRRDVCLEQGFTAQIKLQHLYFSIMYYSIHFSKELKQDVSVLQSSAFTTGSVAAFFENYRGFVFTERSLEYRQILWFEALVLPVLQKMVKPIFLLLLAEAFFELLKGIKLFKKGIQEQTNIKINVKLLFLI